MKYFTTGSIWYDIVLKPYLSYKEYVSKNIALNTPKNTLPKFYGSEISCIQDLNMLLHKQHIYNYDPLQGAIDYYTHPETIQYCMNTGNKEYGQDCDDVAIYSYAVLKNSGFNEKNLEIVTIIPELFPNIQDLKWCHVIFVGFYNNGIPDNSNCKWLYVIDTNTVYQNNIFWFWYKDNDIQKAKNDILNKFSNLYKVKYKYYVEHGYPF